MADDLNIKIRTDEALRNLNKLKKELKDTLAKAEKLDRKKISIDTDINIAELKRKIAKIEKLNPGINFIFDVNTALINKKLDAVTNKKRVAKIDIVTNNKAIDAQINRIRKITALNNKFLLAQKGGTGPLGTHNTQIQKAIELAGRKDLKTSKELNELKKRQGRLLSSSMFSDKKIETAKKRAFDLNQELQKKIKVAREASLKRAQAFSHQKGISEVNRITGRPIDPQAFRRGEVQKEFAVKESMDANRKVKAFKKASILAGDRANELSRDRQKDFEKIFRADNAFITKRNKEYKQLFDKAEKQLTRKTTGKEYRQLFKADDARRTERTNMYGRLFDEAKPETPAERRLTNQQKTKRFKTDYDKTPKETYDERATRQIKKRKIESDKLTKIDQKRETKVNDIIEERKDLYKDLGNLRSDLLSKEKSIASSRKKAVDLIEKEIATQERGTGKRLSNFEKKQYRTEQLQEFEEGPLKDYNNELNKTRESYKNMAKENLEHTKTMGRRFGKESKELKRLTAFQKEYQKVTGRRDTGTDKRIEALTTSSDLLKENLIEQNRITKAVKKTGLSHERINKLETDHSNLLTRKNKKQLEYTKQSLLDADRAVAGGGMRRDMGRGDMAPQRRDRRGSFGRSGSGDTIQQLPQNKLLGRFAQGGMMASGLAATIFVTQMIGAQLMNIMNIMISWEDALDGLVDNLTLTASQMEMLPDMIRGYARNLGIGQTQAAAATEASLQYGISPTQGNVEQLYGLNFSDKVGGYEDAALISRLGSEFAGIMDQYLSKWESFSGKGESSGTLGYEWEGLKSAAKENVLEVWDKNGKGMTDSMNKLSDWMKNNRENISTGFEKIGNIVSTIGKIMKASAPGLLTWLAAWTAFRGGQMIVSGLNAIAKGVTAVTTAIAGSKVGGFAATMSSLGATLFALWPAVLAIGAAWGGWQLYKRIKELKQLNKVLDETKSLTSESIALMSSASRDQVLNNVNQQIDLTEKRLDKLTKRQEKIDKTGSIRPSVQKEGESILGAEIRTGSAFGLGFFDSQDEAIDRNKKNLEQLLETRKKFKTLGQKVFGNDFVLPVADWKEFVSILEGVNKEFGIMPERLASILREQAKIRKEKDTVVAGAGFAGISERLANLRIRKASDKEFGTQFDINRASTNIRGRGFGADENKLFVFKQTRTELTNELKTINEAGLSTIRSVIGTTEEEVNALNKIIAGIELDIVRDEFLRLSTTLRNINNSNELIGLTGLQRQLKQAQQVATKDPKTAGIQAQIEDARFEEFARKGQIRFKKDTGVGSFFDSKSEDEKAVAQRRPDYKYIAEYNIAQNKFQRDLGGINQRFDDTSAIGSKAKKRVQFNRNQAIERIKIQTNLDKAAAKVANTFQEISGGKFNLEKILSLKTDDAQTALFIEEIKKLVKTQPEITGQEAFTRVAEKRTTKITQELKSKQDADAELRKIFGKLKATSGLIDVIGFKTEAISSLEKQGEFQKLKQREPALTEKTLNKKFTFTGAKLDIDSLKNYETSLSNIQSIFPEMSVAQDKFFSEQRLSTVNKLYETQANILEKALKTLKKKGDATEDEIKFLEMQVTLYKEGSKYAEEMRRSTAQALIEGFEFTSSLISSDIINENVKAYEKALNKANLTISEKTKKRNIFKREQQVDQGSAQLTLLKELDSQGLIDFSEQIDTVTNSVANLKTLITEGQNWENLFPDATVDQINKIKKAITELIEKERERESIIATGSFYEGFSLATEEAMKKSNTTAGAAGLEWGKLVAGGIKTGLGGSLAAVMKGEADSIKGIWKSLVDTMVDKFADGVIEMIVSLKWLEAFKSTTNSGTGGGGFWSTLFSAKGNTFDREGHVTAFAKGGAFTNSIVDRTTPFKFGAGGSFGVMGEKTPEAVVPLVRTKTGDLGVRSEGGMMGGNTSISINVENNTGADTEASADEPMWDGEGWVINVFLNAMETNKRGFRNNVKGMIG